MAAWVVIVVASAAFLAGIGLGWYLGQGSEPDEDGADTARRALDQKLAMMTDKLREVMAQRDEVAAGRDKAETTMREAQAQSEREVEQRVAAERKLAELERKLAYAEEEARAALRAEVPARPPRAKTDSGMMPATGPVNLFGGPVLDTGSPEPAEPTPAPRRKRPTVSIFDKLATAAGQDVPEQPHVLRRSGAPAGAPAAADSSPSGPVPTDDLPEDLKQTRLGRPASSAPRPTGERAAVEPPPIEEAEPAPAVEPEPEPAVEPEPEPAVEPEPAEAAPAPSAIDPRVTVLDVLDTDPSLGRGARETIRMIYAQFVPEPKRVEGIETDPALTVGEVLETDPNLKPGPREAIRTMYNTYVRKPVSH